MEVLLGTKLQALTLTPLRSLTDKVQSIRFPLLTKSERLTILNQLQTEIIKEALVPFIKTRKVKGGWEASLSPTLTTKDYRERGAIEKLKKKLRAI